LLAVEHEAFTLGIQQTDGNGVGLSTRKSRTDYDRHESTDAVEEG